MDNTNDPWFRHYANVTRLGRWLVDQGYTAGRLQHYYEKPWNWTNEWREMLAEEAAEKVGA